MKVTILSLLVCALASTALSRPVENEQLPPIGGPASPLNPIILSLAKETLLKVQDNLRAAGRIEEALHLNKFIKNTDRIVEKGSKAVPHAEAFELEDHLTGIYNVLEKYKQYLPVESNDEKVHGLSKPEDENKQLPPIGGPAFGIQTIILDAAKETLLKVQDNLRAAGKIEEALHLNKFIKNTDRIVEKVNKGEVKNLEVFEVEDHLDAVQSVLEKYKQYLPVDQTIALVVPEVTDEDLHQLLRDEIDDLIEQLKEKKQYGKVVVFKIYKKILKDLEYKKKFLHMKKEKYEAILNQIIDYIRSVAEGLRNIFNPTTAATIVDNKISVYSSRSDGQSADFIRGLLDSLVQDLEKIEANLFQSGHFVQASRVKLHKAIVKAVLSNTHSGNYDRKSVNYALNKGMELLKKYKEYLTASKLWSDADLDDEHRESITEDKQKVKDNLSMLEKVRKQLHELREKLHAQRKNIRVKIVETYIKVVDKLIQKLKENKLDNTKLNDFMRLVKNFLEDFADQQKKSISMWSDDDDENLLDLDDDHEDVQETEATDIVDDNEEEKELEPEDLDKEEEKEQEDEKVDENDLLDQEEEEENLSTLEKVRKQLHELRKKLHAQRRSIRVRIVDSYLTVVDALIERLRTHRLDGTRLNIFLERVKKLLEDYSINLRV